MLTIDKEVTLRCTDNDKEAPGIVARIQGNRVDVKLLDGGEMLISLVMQKPGLYVGERMGLEFVMRID